jgi:predicted transcriptional regulator
MAAELELADKFETMNKVVEQKLTGQNMTQIARNLGLTRAQVTEYYDMFKAIAQESSNMKSRAREALFAVDIHYDKLIKEFYQIVGEADDWQMSEGVDAKMLGQKTQALKAIADLEAKRVGLLKDAGLLDDQELANEVMEAERKQQILVDILRDSLCKECSKKVAERLQAVTNTPVAVRVV